MRMLSTEETALLRIIIAEEHQAPDETNLVPESLHAIIDRLVERHLVREEDYVTSRGQRGKVLLPTELGRLAVRVAMAPLQVSAMMNGSAP